MPQYNIGIFQQHFQRHHVYKGERKLSLVRNFQFLSSKNAGLSVEYKFTQYAEYALNDFCILLETLLELTLFVQTPLAGRDGHLQYKHLAGRDGHLQYRHLAGRDGHLQYRNLAGRDGHLQHRNKKLLFLKRTKKNDFEIIRTNLRERSFFTK